MVEAEASVVPATSSTTWTKMCREDRVTTSRGRAAVPETFLRTRRCRRLRADAVLVACRAELDDAAMATYQPFRPCGGLTSPAYRTPLPLYGSGLRSLRMFAATSPTCCLSMPVTENLVGVSTANVMPVGRLDRRPGG